jgi:P27 family predicted phage terminase small subunit
MRQAEAVLDRYGFFALGSTGQVVAHPAVRVLNEASAMFLRYATEFGLTPSSRVKLGLNEAARRTLAMELEEKLGKNPRAA